MGVLKEFLELLEKGDIDAIEAKLKYCKENHPEYDTDIIEFNLMLNDGAHTREECYDWLHKRKFKKEQEFYGITTLKLIDGSWKIVDSKIK